VERAAEEADSPDDDHVFTIGDPFAEDESPEDEAA
jgi:hypothetical protein